MESEKVKEIKKVLEEGQFNTINHYQKEGKPIKISFADILTLINELEKCSEKWQKLCADEVALNTPLKERINELESDNERLKQHKRELQGVQQDLTKRIAELEESIEKWQRKAINYYQMAKSYGVECIIDEDIDETLKEFINE